MEKNDETTKIDQAAKNISDTARDILDRVNAETPPTLAQRATANDERPTLAVHSVPTQRKRGRPRKAIDPILLADLGAKLSTPKKKKFDESFEQDAASGAQINDEGQGGIPPESTGPGKNFAGNPEGASPQPQKKNIKKIVEPLTPDRETALANAKLRARLTSGIRDKMMRQLFELMTANPEIEMHEAMRIVGYSMNTSPGAIVKAKSWQTLVRSMVSDDEIKERERFLLFHEDPRFVNASLDRIHKIMGSFNHTQTNVNVNLDGEIRNMSDSKLYEIIEGEIVEDES